MLSNKRRSPIVTKLFNRGREINIPFHFITQFCFAVRKIIRLNLTNCFIMKIPN